MYTQQYRYRSRYKIQFFQPREYRFTGRRVGKSFKANPIIFMYPYSVSVGFYIRFGLKAGDVLYY